MTPGAAAPLERDVDEPEYDVVEELEHDVHEARQAREADGSSMVAAAAGGWALRRLVALVGTSAIALVAAVGALLLLVVLAVLGATTPAPQSGAGAGIPVYGVSPLALRDIPSEYLGLYQRAGRAREVDWAVLAAIGKIESDHGRSRLAGVRPGSGTNTQAGAEGAGCCAGPMQFFVNRAMTGGAPTTWDRFGVDGNRDGRRDPYDPADAIPASARYLAASGAPGDYRKAIFTYNHSLLYVADVLAWARRYRGPLRTVTAATLPGVAHGSTSAQVLLANANVSFLNPRQKADLQAGRISPRLIALLNAATQRHQLAISALASDHAPGTNHEPGRAVDLAIVDGEICNSHAHRRTGACWRLAQELDQLPGCLRPTELIYGIDPGPSSDSFARSDHADHIHAGYDGPTGRPLTYAPSTAACSPQALTGTR